MTIGIQTKPEPSCPACGSKMVLRRPGRRQRPQDQEDWSPFWGCMDYPYCRGKREIMSDGTPEPDDEFLLADYQ